jgi:hypothetical protein
MFSFKDNLFVAELSCLGDPKLERVYDDAADYGFTIISKKTGKPAVFAFAGILIFAPSMFSKAEIIELEILISPFLIFSLSSFVVICCIF